MEPINVVVNNSILEVVHEFMDNEVFKKETKFELKDENIAIKKLVDNEVVESLKAP